MKGKKSQTQAEAKLVQLVEESFAEKATAWVEPGRRCAIRHWMLWKHNGRSMFDQLCSLWVLIVSQSMLIASHLLPLNVSTPCRWYDSPSHENPNRLSNSELWGWRMKGRRQWGWVKRKREREIGRGVCLELSLPRFVHQCDPGG